MSRTPPGPLWIRKHPIIHAITLINVLGQQHWAGVTRRSWARIMREMELVHTGGGGEEALSGELGGVFLLI